MVLTIDHIHADLDRLRERLEQYDRAPKVVRAAVIARLDQRISFNEVGHTTAGLSALLAGLVGVLAAFVGISITGYSGFLSAVLKLTNPATGHITGITQAQTASTVESLFAPVGGVLVVLVGLLLANILFGRWRDGRRAIAIAWRNLYKDRA
jgi:hypothetical protein